MSNRRLLGAKNIRCGWTLAGSDAADGGSLAKREFRRARANLCLLRVRESLSQNGFGHGPGMALQGRGPGERSIADGVP
jgi:hypothetical protein